MKSKIINVFILLLFLIGVIFIFYPSVTSYLYERESKDVIYTFEEVAEDFVEDNEGGETGESGESEQSHKLYADMQTYNQMIYADGQANLKDPFVFETPAYDLKNYGFDNNVVGYVNIPKMDIELAIYLGATTENMAKGAVNLGYTSTPIGGENTNTVLAAHRGYSGKAMFRNIEALETGDKVYVTNFWGTLTYQVVETRVILPTDIDQIRIQDGKEMLTLITCHPYTKNYQRYVVYCERTAEADEQTEQTDEPDTGLELSYLLKLNKLSQSQRLIFAEKWIPIGISVILFLAVVYRLIFIRKRKRKEKKH